MKQIQALPLPLYCVVLIVIFLLSAASPAFGEFKSLYQDSTGWFISRALAGSDVLAAYKFTPQGYDAIKMRGREKDCLAQLLYVYEQCPSFYYLFFLAVPEGMVLQWNSKSTITVRYTCGRDTLTVRSSELFFATTTKPNGLIFMAKRALSVPSQYIYSQQTWTDKKTGTEYELPAIFARFEFRKMPDRLLNCLVSDVLVTTRR